MKRILGLLVLLASVYPLSAAKTKTLDIYFVDVEGGQATLVVTPGGQSLLIDTGWPGFSMRDANRIAAVAKQAGVKELDYCLLTHYHTDHAGGVPQLLQKLPVKQFLDHGPNREMSKDAQAVYDAYVQAADAAKRRSLKVGETIDMKGVGLQVLTADGENLKGKGAAGAANPACSGVAAKPEDPSENARSLGVQLTWGQFKMVDLGDLTWQKEVALGCPENSVRDISLYVVTHHGFDSSNSPALVNAMNAKVAIMNNGAKKGGAGATFDTLRAASSIKDVWQLHYALSASKQQNSPDSMLANLEEACAGNYIKVSANNDGSFLVYNSRNKFSRSYK